MHKNSSRKNTKKKIKTLTIDEIIPKDLCREKQFNDKPNTVPIHVYFIYKCKLKFVL